MKTVRHENGKIYLTNGWGDTRVFTVVDKAPADYIVWNIGNNMADGYIPFCKLIKYDDPELDWRRDVDIGSLLAVKADNEREWEEVMVHHAPYGANSLAQVRKELAGKTRKSVRRGLEIVLPIFEKIQEG